MSKVNIQLARELIKAIMGAKGSSLDVKAWAKEALDALPNNKPEKRTAIPPGDASNFATIKLAAKRGHLALVSAIRKSDRKRVSLVCAMGSDDTGIRPSPVAVMIEDNPFELFEDPTRIE